MEIKQNPFSLYDFLGYLIPGLFVIFLFSFSFFYFNSPHLSVEDVFKHTNNFLSSSFVAVLLLGYVFGHFLSYLSSMTIERYAEWTLGYPSNYLMNDLPCSYFTKKYDSLVYSLFRFFLVPIFLFPISVYDFVLGFVFKLRKSYAKRLDDDLICLITDLLKKNGFLSSKPNFIHIYHHSIERFKTHYPKIQNYVALYGFSRTISLIFVFIFWFYLYLILFYLKIDFYSIAILSLLSFISFVFYLSYLKFHRRFALEVFLSFA